jgi:hypothetical protein
MEHPHDVFFGEISLAGSTAADGVDEAEAFIELDIGRNRHRRRPIQRLKCGATTAAVRIGPYRDRFLVFGEKL